MNQINKLIEEYRALKPLADSVRKKLKKKFRLEFNFNSNHLEGNTLTYGETELLLLFDQTKGNHELREYEEMKAHDVALSLIEQEAQDEDRPLTEKFIKDLNEIILVRPYWNDAITREGISTRRQIQVGAYKLHPNHVILANGETFEYTSPDETPVKMAELVAWYNEEDKKGELTKLELASLLHYRFVRIHPFDDGNGRVARLLVNYVLYKDILPPIIIKSNDKKNYLRALHLADTGNLQAFIDYMAQQLAWSLHITIRAARGENIEEEDDWEKQLSLLKTRLGDKNSEIAKKTSETLNNLVNQVIIPLAVLYDEKLNLFSFLFLSKETHIDINGSFGSRTGSFSDGLIFLEKNHSLNYINDMSSMTITSEFNTLRQPYVKVNISANGIRFECGENAYVIHYANKTISKLYNETPSEEEISSMLSAIGKDLVNKIEKATETKS